MHEDTSVYKVASEPGSSIASQLEPFLAAGNVPLFISEGDSDRKVRQAEKYDYLTYGFEKLMSNDEPLFLFGFGFGSQDSHIVRAIVESSCPEIYVGLFGNAGRGRIMDVVDDMKERRSKKRSRRKLRVMYYDSASADPWGGVVA